MFFFKKKKKNVPDETFAFINGRYYKDVRGVTEHCFFDRLAVAAAVRRCSSTSSGCRTSSSREAEVVSSSVSRTLEAATSAL